MNNNWNSEYSTQPLCDADATHRIELFVKAISGIGTIISALNRVRKLLGKPKQKKKKKKNTPKETEFWDEM